MTNLLQKIKNIIDSKNKTYISLPKDSFINVNNGNYALIYNEYVTIEFTRQLEILEATTCQYGEYDFLTSSDIHLFLTIIYNYLKEI